MTKTRLAAFAAVILAGAVGLPATGYAAATQTTIHDTFSDPPAADFNPCTGGSGLFSDSGKIVTHETFNASGGGTFTGTVVGTFTFVGDNPADSGSGRFTGWFGGTFNAQGVTQDGGTFTVTGALANGMHIVQNEVAHETIGSDGTVHVQFDRPTLSCN